MKSREKVVSELIQNGWSESEAQDAFDYWNYESYVSAEIEAHERSLPALDA